MIPLTPSNIMFGIGIIGTIFTVYNIFTKPQIDLDKREAINQKEVDGKAELLAYQVTNDRAATDRKFSELQTSIKDAFTLAQNHTHTVEESVKALRTDFNQMNLAVTAQLATLTAIINERIPQGK